MGREVLGEFEHQVLLVVLHLGGEAYSAPVVQELDARTGRDVSPAAVYIALKRMEKKGLVSSRRLRAAPADGGHERLYFRVKEAALEQLRESRRVLEGLWEGLEPHFRESAT